MRLLRRWWHCLVNGHCPYDMYSGMSVFTHRRVEFGCDTCNKVFWREVER